MFVFAIIVFGLGGGLGAFIALRIRRMKTAAFSAVLSAIAFDLLAWRTPFISFASEFVVAALGVGAMGFVFAFFFHIQKYFDPRTGVNRKPRPVIAVTLMWVMLLLAVSVMMPFIERERFAWDLRWSFEGTIIDKYHSPNHGVPTLIVQSPRGVRTEVQGVRLSFWEQAKMGDHVEKQSGRTDGLLNDRRVEIVRPYFRNVDGN
jgi:hypothetical protein